MEQTELRLTPEEGAYIINCTGNEAKKILELTNDGAKNLFESSVACIGASICQVGVRDSQKLLETLVDAAREWNFKDGVLPQIHISGCPSSCGTHQIGRIGFRGGVKTERFGKQVGTILERDIPAFLKALGNEISASGMDFDKWYASHAERFDEISAPFAG